MNAFATSLLTAAISFLVVVPLGCGRANNGDGKTPNERVASLFESMHKGTHDVFEFPKLGWDDVPALMELAPSQRLLDNPPVNKFSSLLQGPTPEGIVALWFVEGIRRGGNRFASLNPSVCGGENEKVRSKELSHEEWQAANNKAALKAYQDWWKHVQSMPREQAEAIDPLKGTNLMWY